MSIEDINKVDGIAVSEDGKELFLLITDHMSWKNEYEHLIKLQDKVNSYISYLESEQYKELYPDKQFLAYCIEIHFKYSITENCSKFIQVVNNQLSESSIKIKAIIV